MSADTAFGTWGGAREILVEATRREKAAVVEEMERCGLDRPVIGRHGVRTTHTGASTTYQCEITAGLLLAEATPAMVTMAGERTRGQVVAYAAETGELTIEIASPDLPERFDEAAFQFDPSFLLEQLAVALEGLTERSANVRLAHALLTGTGAVGDETLPAAVRMQRPGLNPSQTASIARALGSEVTYVWGPPGTGKTSTLAHYVAACLARGERVAVLAPTNVATDTLGRALLGDGMRSGVEAAAVAGAHALGGIVRLGEASPWAREAGVDLDAAVERWLRVHAPALLTEVESAWLGLPPAARRNATTARARMRALERARAAGEALVSAMQGAEGATIQDARILLTTLTKFYLTNGCPPRPFDVVIVDEVSMASPPAVFFAATRAKHRVVAGGDFQQLPPVVVGRHPVIQRCLGRSVFALARVDDPEAELARRPMLRTQYRMRPPIASVVGRLFYAGRLEDAPHVRERATTPGVGAPLRLLDTSGANVSSTKTEHGSRVNEVHARLVVQLVLRALDDGCESVGIVAPYSAQVRLIRQLLRAHGLDGDPRVVVGTVHRFQGGERDLIIFDSVDAPPVPTRFLDDRHSGAALPLVNVAISRAREALVVVACADHLLRQLGRDASLARLLAHLRTHAHVVRPEDVEGGRRSPAPVVGTSALVAGRDSLQGCWVRIAGAPRYVVTDEGSTVLVSDPTGTPVRHPAKSVEAVKRDGRWTSVGAIA